ncbi:hypothetical protein [Streptomyces sp. B6B3]|uniref:hypothetical protein n=1 Tax=Streptomyces sp. B6B3 TaxID=3153570 RepID=UPI00325D7E9E
MTKRTAPQLAEQAAEAIRALNHATRATPNACLRYPGDVYATFGELVAMAGRLPQAIGQLALFIDVLQDEGRLRHDSGNPSRLGIELASFEQSTADAFRAAQLLRRALDGAHQALGRIGYQAAREEGDRS